MIPSGSIFIRAAFFCKISVKRAEILLTAWNEFHIMKSVPQYRMISEVAGTHHKK